MSSRVMGLLWCNSGRDGAAVRFVFVLVLPSIESSIAFVTIYPLCRDGAAIRLFCLQFYLIYNCDYIRFDTCFTLSVITQDIFGQFRARMYVCVVCVYVCSRPALALDTLGSCFCNAHDTDFVLLFAWTPHLPGRVRCCAFAGWCAVSEFGPSLLFPFSQHGAGGGLASANSSRRGLPP